MAQSPGVWQSPKKTTIDATTPDEGLDAARAAYPAAGSHVDVADAVDNIMAGTVAFGRTAQLVGHGLPGLIGVGCGKVPLAPDEYIALANEAVWTPVLGALAGRVQALRLTGCYVGAEQDGADLLERVSCVIGAPVLAPNGWAVAVAGENISLQDGSIWQVGQCNIPPHPIPKPNDPIPPAPALLFMTETGEHEIVPVERVQGLDFKRSAFLNASELHLKSKAAQNLLGAVKFEAPRPLHGEPLAMPTGELSIRYTDSNGEQHERHFEVLSDRLLRDHAVPGVVYEVTEPMRAAFPKYDVSERRG